MSLVLAMEFFVVGFCQRLTKAGTQQKQGSGLSFSKYDTLLYALQTCSTTNLLPCHYLGKSLDLVMLTKLEQSTGSSDDRGPE